MPSKSKILVIGDGPVGASAISTLCRQGFHDIFVSRHTHGELKKESIFKQNIPTAYEGKGGLGRLWHSVCDLGLLCRLDVLPSDLSKRWIGNIEFKEDSEFVPFFPIRPSKLITKLRYGVRSSAVSLESLENNVAVTFSDGSVESFDKVLVCHGALPNTDCLVNSGLATLSNTVSDHLVAQVEGIDGPLFPRKKIERVEFSKKGFVRKYLRYDTGKFKFKMSARPNYGEKINKAFHMDKGIYVGSTFEVLKRIFRKASFNFIKQSFFLRYGIFSRSESWTGFVNIAVKDCYKIKKGSLVVDESRIRELAIDLAAHNFRLVESSLMSAIHFHNTYNYLSPEVSNNVVSDKRIILLGPGYNFEVGAEHFTFQMMLIAEKVARELYVN